MKHPRATVLINLVVPGAGLIILRREWLGLAISLLFGGLCEIGVLGWLLLPSMIPRWLCVTMLASASVIWLGAQVLLMRRWRQSCGSVVGGELMLLIRRSDEAITADNLDEAHDLLRAALSINDEHVDVLERWARLMAQMGHGREAAKAWRRVLQLSDDSVQRGHASKELSGSTR